MFTANKGVEASLHYIIYTSPQAALISRDRSCHIIMSAAAVMIDFRIAEPSATFHYTIYYQINVITRGRVCGCFGQDGMVGGGGVLIKR